MKRSTFFAVTGVLAVLFGAWFLALPATALSHDGVPTEAHNLMQARHFGSTLLMVGLVVWLARATQDPTAAQALLVGTGIGDAIGAALSAWAAVSGLQNRDGLEFRRPLRPVVPGLPLFPRGTRIAHGAIGLKAPGRHSSAKTKGPLRSDPF